ncbi:MAG: CHAT domain-containing protein [Gemmatimonadota bacterium]|nr:CHAT domain-containing protein [Gemmatimonadota bacterium]
MRYHNFDLWIEKAATGALVVRSSCEEHGEYKDECSNDLASLRLAEHRIIDGDPAPHEVVNLGKQLYTFAFASAQRRVEWHFAQCWGTSGRGDNGVRVRLRVEDPAVASIPWEFLYSEQLQSFLGVSTRTPVVRYLELPRPIGQLEASLPVKMLVVIPRVADLETDVERRELVETLAPLADIVSLTILEGDVTRQDIADTLISHSFHLLHFIGHGDFNGDRAVLAVNGADGKTDLIDQTTFAQMLRNHTTMKLVVLNSCRGGQMSQTKPLVGMAAALVKEGVPAVIAMQYEVQDREAITFARTLYRALFTGDDRGRIEIAMSHARNALAIEYPDTRALGLPVLFTHAREGVLFDLGADKAVPDKPLSKRALSRDQATLATHKRNIELLREPVTGDAPQNLELAREEKAYSRTARRIRLRYASVFVAVGSALVVFLLSILLGFQRLPPPLRVESYAVWLTDRFDHHLLDPSIAIVSVDRRSERSLGPMTGASRFAWRGHHARLIDRLTAAGARTIAFTFVFDTTAGPFDDSLVASIRRAKASGTEVVIGVDQFVNGAPQLVPLLAGATRWGPACLGDNRVHSLKMLPMMIGSASSQKPARTRSLALQTVMVHTRAVVDDRIPLSDGLRLSGRSGSIVPSELMIADGTGGACPSISAGDTLAEMYVEYSPLAELRASSRHRSYVDLLGGVGGGTFENGLVIVGRESNDPSRVFKVRRGFAAIEERTSVEIFADAVNSLLGGSLIRPLGQTGQFLFILAMAVLGAAAASLPRIKPSSAFRRQLRRLQPFVLLGAAFVGYGALAMWFYSAHHLLLNTVFHVTSLVATFIAVALIRRKWLA